MNLKNQLNEVTDWDQKIYQELVRTSLDQRQEDIIRNPQTTFDQEQALLAIHWHPEIVPLFMAKERIEKMYPNKKTELVIPTQHNELMVMDGFAGAEIDCLATEFNQKIQLLIHFSEEKVKDANKLRSMLSHTFQYRADQFFQFMESLTEKHFEKWIDKASCNTGADKELIECVSLIAKKLHKLVNQNLGETPKQSVKNKLIRNFLLAHKDIIDPQTLKRMLIFIKAVKKAVKKDFDLNYFYTANEVIEEVRGLGGCITIPHPELFWPALLVNYDVDGIEVWNPNSATYTDFLINVINDKNSLKKYKDRPILPILGDDCHLGAKLIDQGELDSEKAKREIGYQPTWKLVTKTEIFSKESIIEEYRNRLLR